MIEMILQNILGIQIIRHHSTAVGTIGKLLSEKESLVAVLYDSLHCSKFSFLKNKA
jgi:hypothetical protein